MNDNPLQALYGLTYIPFRPSVVSDVLWKRPGLEAFVTRVESLAHIGGLARLSGDTGPGKSKALQMLADHLDQFPELAVRSKEQDDE